MYERPRTAEHHRLHGTLGGEGSVKRSLLGELILDMGTVRPMP